MSKILNQQQATLILRTNTADISNNVKSFFTWSNMDLSKLIGNTMWEKYDFFNIALVEVGAGVGAVNLGVSLDDCNVAFLMTGLSFVNSSYIVQRQTILNRSIVGFLNFNRSAVSNQVFSGNNVSTFNKNTTVTDLTITYYTVGDTTAQTPVAFPDVCFIFKIVGIPKENLGQPLKPNKAF
jgi:hypothetical protein